jgi:hypothetical protein
MEGRGNTIHQPEEKFNPKTLASTVQNFTCTQMQYKTLANILQNFTKMQYPGTVHQLRRTNCNLTFSNNHNVFIFYIEIVPVAVNSGNVLEKNCCLGCKLKGTGT